MKYLGIVSLLSCFLLAACKPYQMDIAQGKDVTPEQTAQIKIGMSKEAVLADLGTPLQGTSAYDPNRLDYVYTMQKNGGEIQEKRFTVYFKNNVVSKTTQQENTIAAN